MIKEILILHHSHFDYGYTHTQPVLKELQIDHIENAIKLCDDTANWESESRPSWTCEVTMPVMWALDSLNDEQLDKLGRYVSEGRINFAAMSHNPTATLNLREGVKMLEAAEELRKRFSAPLSSVVLHDVNGISWGMGDVMLDSGIDFMLMGINIHFGGFPFEKRPYIFDWELPSGRKLRVFNAEHYSMFNCKLKSDMEDIELMEKKLQNYLKDLEEQEYPYDWAYLSATITPHSDNTGPNPNLAALLRKWNSSGRLPIRFVTADQLAEKVKSVDHVQVHRGDWSDFWSFGVGSNAHELRLQKRGRTDLQAAELTAATTGNGSRRWEKVCTNAWDAISCYTEHTYGANDSILDPDGENARSQAMMKQCLGHKSQSLGGFAMERQLEKLAGNPIVSQGYEGLLLVNPGPMSKTHLVDRSEFKTGNEHNLLLSVENSFTNGAKPHTLRFEKRNRDTFEVQHRAQLLPVTLPPYSWRILSINDLTTNVPEMTGVAVTHNSIETEGHRLTFCSESGKITSLFDKDLEWEVIPEDVDTDFFTIVRETPVLSAESIDPGRKGREELFEVDWEQVHKGISLWRNDWEVEYTKLGKLLDLKVIEQPGRASLVRRFEMAGTEWLELTMTLVADSSVIEMVVQMQKTDVRTAESYTMPLPLNLPEGWSGHYDTCGIVTELDEEQLADTCRDFLTVDRIATIHNGNRGATLFCQDAPLVHLGGKGFGRSQKSVSRAANPMLGAWLLNNYWDTNFPASQPGRLSFRYQLQTHAQPDFDSLLAMAEGHAVPVYEFDTSRLPDICTGKLLEISDSKVSISVYPMTGSNGVMMQLSVQSDRESVTVKLPLRLVKSACVSNPNGESLQEIKVKDGGVTVALKAKTPAYIKLNF